MRTRRFRKPARIIPRNARVRRRLGCAGTGPVYRGPSIQRRYLGLVAALCLVAAACVGQQAVSEGADLQPVDPAVAEPRGTDEGVDADGKGGSVSSSDDSDGIQEISIDVLGYLFPATAADASNLYPLGRLFGAVTHTEIAECMGQAGFEYPPFKDEESVPRFFDFPDLETIAEVGFGGTHGIVREPQPNSFEMIVPPDLEDQFRLSESACLDQVDDPIQRISDTAGILEDKWWNELFEIDASPAIVEQFQLWRQCIAEGGLQVSSHDDFFSQLERVVVVLLDDLEPADVEAARAEEMAAAELYVSCMEPLEEVRQPLRDAARRQFLEDNSEEVRAIQELADRLIREAQQQ